MIYSNPKVVASRFAYMGSPRSLPLFFMSISLFVKPLAGDERYVSLSVVRPSLICAKPSTSNPA